MRSPLNRLVHWTAAIAMQFSLLPCTSDAEPLISSGEVKLEGELSRPDQLSGIALHKGFLVICPDEGAGLDVLERQSPTRYELKHHVTLLDGTKREIDMEGLASSGKSLYVLGSHSLVRERLKGDSYDANRELIYDVDKDEDRDTLYRIKLDDSGKLTENSSISLREILKDDKLLKRFAKIPSKENGVDLEGVAIRNGTLYAGFRAPVLRELFVPITVFDFDDPDEYELRFVNLSGRGIRDLVAVEDGFLLIGGPMGDGEQSYELYFWNGKDCIPGDGSPGGETVALGTIPAMGDAKAEGIAVIGESNREWDVLVVFDGLPNKAVRFLVRDPR